MARSTSWKGYLKLSLVTCAVAMAPAQSDREKVRFNTLNRATGNRLKMQMIDSETGDVVEREDQVKGYQIEKGRYLQIEEEEFEAIELESKHTIDIEEFVPAGDVDRVWMGDHNYLMPDDEVAIEAFSVIRDAMARTNTAGIARVTMNNRERWIAVRPRGRGILLTAMRYPYEVRSEAQAFESIDSEKPDAKSLEAMEDLIDQMAGKFDPDELIDRYQTALQKLLKEKQKGHESKTIKIGDDREERPKVVNMLDALRRSLDAEKSKDAKPKKTAAKRKSRAA